MTSLLSLTCKSTRFNHSGIMEQRLADIKSDSPRGEWKIIVFTNNEKNLQESLSPWDFSLYFSFLFKLFPSVFNSNDKTDRKVFLPSFWCWSDFKLRLKVNQVCDFKIPSVPPYWVSVCHDSDKNNGIARNE